MVNFKKIIGRIKECSGLTQKEMASEIFGISDKNLSNKIKRGSIDLGALIQWAGNENVDLNWLLTGKGTPTLENTEGLNEPGDSDLINSFSDKEYARDLNLYLVQLEKHYPETFREIAGFIKGLLHRSGLPFKPPTGPPDYTGLKRRVAERRVKDDPSKIPGGKDRRSGKDRRAGA